MLHQVLRFLGPLCLLIEMRSKSSSTSTGPLSIIRIVKPLALPTDSPRLIACSADESDKQLEWRKQELSDVITEVLRRYPALCYFQGYHDIVQVILLVLGSDQAPSTVTRLSLLRIRDFMLPSLDAAISHLHLLPAILDTVDPTVRRHLSQTQPFFALAATLTLYAHDIQEYGDIARLFDFFLAREAVIPVYFFAVVSKPIYLPRMTP